MASSPSSPKPVRCACLLYPSYAQEQGLVKTEDVWSANRGSNWFSDYSATQFRVPDLRDMFRRFMGTDADTANARTHASRQADALQGHGHELWYPFTGTTSGSGSLSVSLSTNPASGISMNYASGSLRDSGQGTPRNAKETRPVNVAFLPQMCIRDRSRSMPPPISTSTVRPIQARPAKPWPINRAGSMPT